MKKILITGGAGFIGSHLAVALSSEGHQVTVLDNLSPQIHGADPEIPDFGGADVSFIRGDVRYYDDWEAALKGQQVVVHLAAETGTGQSMYEVHRYADVNIGGTAHLLDYLVNARHSVEKVIVASSRAVYGEGKYRCSEHGTLWPGARKEAALLQGYFEPRCPLCGVPLVSVPTDEDSPLQPTSVYGITKQNQEQMVMQVCRSVGIPAVVFRYQNVYGPGQSLRNPYTGILSVFSTLIRNGQPLTVFEDGLESRDFVYIDDVVAATVLGIRKSEADHEIFNVGSGTATTVLEVTKLMKAHYRADVPVNVSGGFRLGDIRHNTADLSHIGQKLGFSPQTDFYTGSGRFATWVKAQCIEEDRYEASIHEMEKRGLFKKGIR